MRVYLIALAAFVVLASSALIGREYRSTLLFRSTEQQKIVTLSKTDAIVEIPLSARGLRETMILCANLQLSFAVMLQPEDVQNDLRRVCISAAQKISGQYPTFASAYTYLIGALDEREAKIEALSLSHLTARYESWQAKFRVKAVLDLLDPDETQTRNIFDDDVDYMLQSDWGRRWLAEVYSEETTPRDIFKQAIERQPEAIQAMFIRELRRSAANLNR